MNRLSFLKTVDEVKFSEISLKLPPFPRSLHAVDEQWSNRHDIAGLNLAGLNLMSTRFVMSDPQYLDSFLGTVQYLWVGVPNILKGTLIFDNLSMGTTFDSKYCEKARKTDHFNYT